MSESRQEWLDALARHVCHFERPADGPWWCPEYDRMAPESLRQLHSEKLPLAVRYMYEQSPMYRHKLDEAGVDPASIHSVDDLERLPIVTKDDMSAPDGGYLAVDEDYWDRHGWMMFNTSGTTGLPRTFRYTDADRRMWMWTDARALWAMGIRPGDRALLCFGYGPHVAMWEMLYGLNRMTVPVIPSGGMDSRARAAAQPPSFRGRSGTRLPPRANGEADPRPRWETMARRCFGWWSSRGPAWLRGACQNGSPQRFGTGWTCARTWS